MLLLFLYAITAIAHVGCIGVTISNETENGSYSEKYEIFFEFKMDGKTYFFALGGFYWFIKELLKDGTLGPYTDKGKFAYTYNKGFAYNIQGKQYVYAITETNYWFIQEILTGGRLGKETSKGRWDSTPNLIFPVNVNREYFVLTVSSQNWYMKQLTSAGTVGKQTDKGKWIKYYTLGFPFSIQGRQFIYLTDTARWSTREVISGGKMGKEIVNGQCRKKPLLYYPFFMRGKQYYYGLNQSKKDWFIQEFKPSGKMGSVHALGLWEDYYHVALPFTTDGVQFMHFLNDKNYITRKVKQTPPFCPILVNPQSYCSEEPKLKCGPLYPRVKRVLNYGGSSEACTDFNFINDYIADIMKDDYYVTVKVNDPKTALKSYSLLKKGATIDLTVAMNAEIYQKHLTSEKSADSQAVRDHVRKLEQDENDEIGHLLAPSLGGTLQPYNFVPQSPMINRKLLVAGNSIRAPQRGWFDVERLIRNYVTETAGHVGWHLVISYGNLANSLRPTEFWLLVKFYDADGKLTNWGANRAITGYHFRNVPTEACENLNSTWWNIPY
uniref:Uncharacterized protein n=1 Tax=Bactrocera dorsalis TaxID=27457 RepID=A0A034V5B1_BACDO